MSVFIIPGFLRKKEFYRPLAENLRLINFKVSLQAKPRTEPPNFGGSGSGVKIIDLGFNFKNLDISSKIVYQNLKKSPGKHDIIAHSYGGIVLKYLLFKKPKIINQLKSVIFVCVPHGGSWQALLLSLVPAVREVLPFRKRLKKLSHVPLPENTVNFISEKELYVWPRKHGLLKDYIDIVIPETNHVSIINNKNFITKATEFINSNYDQFFKGH